MENSRETNIKKTLWHIKRYCEVIERTTNIIDRETELLYSRNSVEVLIRVFNNENPYPHLDNEEVF